MTEKEWIYREKNRRAVKKLSRLPGASPSKDENARGACMCFSSPSEEKIKIGEIKNILGLYNREHEESKGKR